MEKQKKKALILLIISFVMVVISLLNIFAVFKHLDTMSMMCSAGQMIFITIYALIAWKMK